MSGCWAYLMSRNSVVSPGVRRRGQEGCYGAHHQRRRPTHSCLLATLRSMMGERRVDQSSLFYEFSLERHVPADHLLRATDLFVDLADLRVRLAPFYSSIGRP